MVFDSEILVFLLVTTLSEMLLHYPLCLLPIWVLTFCPKNNLSLFFLSLKSNSSFNGTLYTFELTEKLSLFLLTRLFKRGIFSP